MALWSKRAEMWCLWNYWRLLLVTQRGASRKLWVSTWSCEVILLGWPALEWLHRLPTTTNTTLNMSFELIICSTVRLLILSLSLVARVANFHADWAIERFVDLDIIVCFHYGLIFNVQRRTTNDLWNESIKTKYVFIFLFCVIRDQKDYTAY